MNQSRIEGAVEAICQRGCRYVNALLAEPEQLDCDALVNLSSAERSRVLEELRSVMAVYQTTGSCDL